MPRIDPAEAVEITLRIADAEGLRAVTMRRVAGELGVAAMSLYRHFADKDALLTGIGEAIGDEIEAYRRDHPLPADADVWARLRDRVRSPVEVLFRHDQDVTQLLQAQNAALAPGAFPAEVVDAHEQVLALLGELSITGLEAAQWVFLIRESVFMLANACRRSPLPLQDADDGHGRLVAHWRAPRLADSGLRPLTAETRRSLEHASSVPSLLDRGVEMIVSAVRARATELGSDS